MYDYKVTGGRVPVQGDGAWHLKNHSACKPTDKVPGTIEWWEHLRAYEDYSKRYGTDQSAERLAERGGFSYLELIDHLGHPPTTWKPRD